jgi:hypothetical protein
MNRHLLAALALAVAAAASRPAGAQVRAPNISAPKGAASRVVNRVNAHTAEMTGGAASGSAAAAAPSGPAVMTPIVATSGPNAAKPTPATSGAKATTAAAIAAAPQTSRPTTTQVPETAARPDTSASTATRGARGQISFMREVFAYAPEGRRDPFYSLLASGELRPLLSDLKLVTVIYDPTGRNSVAILRDVSTRDQYRVKVGQALGRMRVQAILPKQVNFVVEEFGYSRQESLTLNETTKARTR